MNDTISVTTGVILDANGHAVPDDTPVEFSLGYPGELPSTARAGTQDGMASISTTLGRLGLLTITAQSEPARLVECCAVGRTGEHAGVRYGHRADSGSDSDG